MTNYTSSILEFRIQTNRKVRTTCTPDVTVLYAVPRKDLYYCLVQPLPFLQFFSCFWLVLVHVDFRLWQNKISWRNLKSKHLVNNTLYTPRYDWNFLEHDTPSGTSLSLMPLFRSHANSIKHVLLFSSSVTLSLFHIDICHLTEHAWDKKNEDQKEKFDNNNKGLLFSPHHFRI